MGAFSVFSDKKKKKRETPSIEAHYTRLARYASLARYAVLVVIVLFAVYAFSFHSNEITIENFEYMMKFLNVGDDENTYVGSHIAFDGSKGNRGIIYKGDLAILNENGLTVAGWDGDVILREVFTFDHPKMIENGVNLFCYDLGGKELRIFNSYSQLQRLQYDYPIHWVSTAKSGEFAVVSSAKGYRSAVYVYDKDFRIRYSRLFGDKYVDFTAISPDGQEFITAAHYSKKGNLVTQLAKFNINQENAVFETEFIGEIPLGIYYTEAGYCLLTTDTMRTFDNENNVISEVSFNDSKLLSGKVFDKYALINYSMDGLSGGTEATVYLHDGSVCFKKQFNTSLTDSIICGDKLYTLSPGVLTECDVATGNERVFEIPTSYSSLVADGDSIILFSENRAEYFDTEKGE